MPSRNWSPPWPPDRRHAPPRGARSPPSRVPLRIVEQFPSCSDFTRWYAHRSSKEFSMHRVMQLGALILALGLLTSARHARPAAGLGRRRPDADHRPADLAQARRVGHDFAQRPVGRLHRARHQLGRERLPHRDLARRREVGRAAAAHQPREEVEHVARLVARQHEAGVCDRPRRQAADLRDRPARRRGAQADLGRGGRRRLRLGARRQVASRSPRPMRRPTPTRSARRSSASST